MTYAQTTKLINEAYLYGMINQETYQQLMDWAEKG